MTNQRKIENQVNKFPPPSPKRAQQLKKQSTTEIRWGGVQMGCRLDYFSKSDIKINSISTSTPQFPATRSLPVTNFSQRLEVFSLVKLNQREYELDNRQSWGQKLCAVMKTRIKGRITSLNGKIFSTFFPICSKNLAA